MEYIIRTAENGDLKDITELEQQCFSFPHTLSQLENELNDPLYLLFVAAEEKKIIGYAGLMHVADEGYITNVAVYSDARRKGIADALMYKLDSVADELELSFISLEVRSSNLPAKGLYVKHGYIQQAILPGYYSKPTEDGLIMTKYR